MARGEVMVDCGYKGTMMCRQYRATLYHSELASCYLWRTVAEARVYQTCERHALWDYPITGKAAGCLSDCFIGETAILHNGMAAAASCQL